jgi:hypothetical protein
VAFAEISKVVFCGGVEEFVRKSEPGVTLRRLVAR